MTTMVTSSVKMDLPPTAELDSTSHKRYANDLIRSSARRSPQAQPLGFLCECASSECFKTVWLTRREYDDCHNGRRTRVLAGGHTA